MNLDIKFRLVVIIVMVGLIAAVWAFPAWWPVLNTDTVAERFPGLALEVQPDFINLSSQVQTAYLELREDEEAPPGLALALVEARLLTEDEQAPEANEPFEPDGLTIVRSGEFGALEDDILREASGEVTIYQRSNLTRLLRFDSEFTSTRAPDVHVILTRNPDPFDERGVGVDYIDLGPLKGNVGAQNYDVPEGVNFNVYPILALYSVEYDYVIGAATLR